MSGSAGPGISGRCLCGAVTLDVARYEPTVSACHCAMCRRWTGGVLFGFDAPAEAVDVTGPARTRATSAFAERAWCDECGSHLWFRKAGEGYELTPGLFDAARTFSLVREVYADRALAACALAGERRRVSADEYERNHPSVQGDDAR